MSRSEIELRALARRLRVFRFCKALGGHANDGDSLLAVYAYASEAELMAFYTHLGVTNGPRARYETGVLRMDGAAPHARLDGGRIYLTLGGQWEVAEADVAAAEIVEKRLEGAPLSLVEPPLDDEHCVCPKYYPDWFD